MRLDARLGEPLRRTTMNVAGLIPGRGSDAVLLSAHYDHLGVRNGQVFPGANDNASGVAAVLELARLLKGDGPHARGALIAFFGCEEEGGHGSIALREAPPVPLSNLVANLNFEMVGQRDPANPRSLALTGWNRSDLGPTLAANGAPLAADAYPRAMLFERSDNYFLALNGVVAHSVMGWPTPPNYHRPTDDAAAIDFGFLAEAVQAMAGPIRWLLDSDFRPAWAPGRKP
jgi:Zn-dependent M28 family amino/carboxypeptidase